MKIFIVNNNISSDKTCEIDLFQQLLLRKIIIDKADVKFLISSAIEHKDQINSAPTIQRVVISKIFNNNLLRKYWYGYKLPALIKKYKIDILISLTGISSSLINFPQFTFINNIDTFKKISGQIMKTTTTFLVFSQHAKDKIIELYPFLEKRVKVIPVFYTGNKIEVDIYDRELIRQEYTDSKNYFLFNANSDDKVSLIILLKAFSIFKKRQKSDWKFVFIGRFKNRADEFMNTFKSYKYREDVVLIEKSENPNLEKLLAGSYAWINPIKEEFFGLAVLEPIIYNVPVLVAKETAFQELAGEAGLYFDFGNQQSLADQMMYLYKDEGQRNTLGKRGKDRVKNLNIENSAKALWHLIHPNNC